MQEAVERAIETMWARYPEDLSLEAMAESAHLSRFYFSRLFRATIGTSPGRFLSAIRLFEAQDLLVETTTSVTDIAYGVGYNSLGTFISRFTRSVGRSPGRYRRESLPALGPRAGRRTGSVRGQVAVPSRSSSVRVHVGVFASPLIDRDPPAAYDVLDNSGEFVLPEVSESTWYVRAALVPVGDRAAPATVESFGPLRVRTGMISSINLEPHPASGVSLRVRPAPTPGRSRSPRDLPVEPRRAADEAAGLAWAVPASWPARRVELPPLRWSGGYPPPAGASQIS